MKRITSILLSVLLMFAGVIPVSAQSPLSKVAGITYASAYANWRAQIANGSAPIASGAATIVVAPGIPSNPDGTQVFGAFVNAQGTIFTPIIVGLGTANQETVTPTAVSGCNSGSQSSPANCLITATFSNPHGPGDLIASGDSGVQEAINSLPAGGVVVLDNASAATNTILAAVVPFSASVQIEDTRGPNVQWYTVQPSTLSLISAPAQRSGTAGNTQVISGTATGTWPNSTEHVCVTYVDVDGGESACSTDFSFTATLNVALNYAAPAASTGAVGWRAYAGLATTTEYQLPISSSTCTLSTQTPYPTCSMASAGVFPTPATTTALAPGYVVNTYHPATQAHTTFAYQPSAKAPSSCSPQSNYGPFTITAGGTTGQIQVLGTVQLTTGCLNTIGRTIRVTGKISAVTGSAETPSISVLLGPTFTTGTPTAICTMTSTTTTGTGVTDSDTFSCTMTTNSTGATGTLMPNGWAIVQSNTGTASASDVMVDTATAAITNSLTTQDTLFITYTGTSATNTSAKLVSLSIEDL